MVYFHSINFYCKVESGVQVQVWVPVQDPVQVSVQDPRQEELDVLTELVTTPNNKSQSQSHIEANKINENNEIIEFTHQGKKPRIISKVNIGFIHDDQS